jgi:hypothetical protein
MIISFHIVLLKRHLKEKNSVERNKKVQMDDARFAMIIYSTAISSLYKKSHGLAGLLAAIVGHTDRKK